jgi:molecular chaperone GrpE
LSVEDDEMFVDAEYLEEDDEESSNMGESDKPNPKKDKKNVKKPMQTQQVIEEKQEEKPKNITISVMEYEELNDTIEEQKEKYDKLYERFQRVQADFENYKKFLEKQKADTINYASGQLIKKLLNVLDNFERALNAVDESKKEEEFFQGIGAIYNDFYSILEKEGLKPIDCSGEFDPYYHECLLTEEREDCKEDQIIEVLNKGYKFKDKVLRPAMVKVAKEKKIEPCVDDYNDKEIEE